MSALNLPEPQEDQQIIELAQLVFKRFPEWRKKHKLFNLAHYDAGTAGEDAKRMMGTVNSILKTEKRGSLQAAVGECKEIILLTACEILSEELPPPSKVPSKRLSTSRPSKRLSADLDVEGPAAKAFLAKYATLPGLGSAADALLGVIKLILPDQNYFSAVLPVLQSSGMGKSRAVHELSRSVRVVNVVLRRPEQERYLEYPPTSPGVCEYFLAGGTASSPLQVQEKRNAAAAWFCALFVKLEELHDELNHLEKDNWRALFGHRPSLEQRTFFNGVNQLARKLLSKEQAEVEEHSAEGNVGAILNAVEQRLRAELRGYVFRFLSLSDDYEGSKKVGLVTAGPNPNMLRRRFSHAFPLVVAFDEAHNLGPPALAVLDSIGIDIKRVHMPICILTLSTTSRVSERPPPVTSSSSSRVLMSGTQSTGPFFALPYNLHVSSFFQQLRGKELSLSYLREPYAMATFGRPLWRASVAHLYGQGLLVLAQAKLLGDDYYPGQNRNEVLAVFRYALVPSRHPSGQQLAHATVARHGATVLAVPDSRAYINVYYPAEPLLGVAARSAFLEKTRTPADVEARTLDVLRAIQGMRETQKLNDSRRRDGETFAKVAFQRAGDMSFLEMYWGGPLDTSAAAVTASQWHQPIRLVTFFKHLLGFDLANPALADADAVTAQFRLNTAVVDFTVIWHILPSHMYATGDVAPDAAKDQVVIDEGTVGQALARGAILQLAEGTWQQGFVIPFLLDPSKPIRAGNLGAILVQIKNREKPNKSDAHLPQDELIVPPGSKMPVIYILWELGLPFAEPDLRLHQPLAAHRSSKATKAPYLSLTAKGLHPGTYPGSTWADLLSPDRMGMGFPRGESNVLERQLATRPDAQSVLDANGRDVLKALIV